MEESGGRPGRSTFLFVLVVALVLFGSVGVLVSGSRLEPRGERVTGNVSPTDESEPDLLEPEQEPAREVAIAVNAPADGVLDPGQAVTLTGTAQAGARVTANRAEVQADPNTGNFAIQVPLRDGVNQIRVAASIKGLATGEATLHICYFNNRVDVGCDNPQQSR